MIEDKVLFVDDDPNILAAYRRQLRKVLRIETAEGPERGLRLVTEWGPFAVVVADMRMPAMNGIQFLARVRELSPDTVRVMLTGEADMKTAVQAINEGSIFRFLTKPCPPETMVKALTASINQYRLVTSERDLLETTLNSTIDLLAEILALVEPDAFGRASYLRECARLLGQKLKVPQLWQLELAATLSQIGYVAVPRDLVRKVLMGEEPSETERDVLLQAPEVAYELLSKIPRLEPVAEIVRYQNKRFDGSGFPSDSLAGSDIPLGSRILKVLIDLLDTEHRGDTRADALEKMQQRDGWYDPRILVAAGGVDLPSHGALEAETGIKVNLQELRPGLVLLSNVETLDNRLLIRAGHVISEAVLARIHSHAALVGVKEPIKVCPPEAPSAS